MVWKAILVLAVLPWAGPSFAGSTTSCRPTLMGGMDCTTISSEHPYDAGQRSMQEGINSLANAIAARGAKKREERERQAAQAQLAATRTPLVDFSSGNGFLSGCKAPANDLNAGLCWGYFEGFMRREFSQGTPMICFPEQSTKRQAFDTIINYIETHPAERHFPIAFLTSVSLMQAFPCSQPVNQPVVQPTPPTTP